MKAQKIVPTRIAADPAPASIELNATQAQQLSALVERMAARTGESPADVRRAVEIAIVTRGIAEVQKGLM